MTLPTGYLPRKGDVLILHGTAKYDYDAGDTYVHVVMDGRAAAVAIDFEDIKGVFCRKWDIGDKVRAFNNPAIFGTVVAVYEDQVWMKVDEQSTFTEPGLHTIEANLLEANVPDGTLVEHLEPALGPLTVEEPPAAPAPGPMRFSVGQTAILAREPDDSVRAEYIAPYIGRLVEIFGIEGCFYKVTVLNNGTDFFVSDAMLDPAPPKRIDEAGAEHF